MEIRFREGEGGGGGVLVGGLHRVQGLRGRFKHSLWGQTRRCVRMDG